MIQLLPRTAFILLLLFAFLQSVLKCSGVDPANHDGRQILIVFDHSLNLANTAAARPPAQPEARLEIHYISDFTRKREIAGERRGLSFTPGELGFHGGGSPRPTYASGINAATDLSDPRPIDKNVPPAKFPDNHGAHAVSGDEDYDDAAKGRPIFRWLVFSALAILVLECGFQFLIRRRKK